MLPRLSENHDSSGNQSPIELRSFRDLERPEPLSVRSDKTNGNPFYSNKRASIGLALSGMTSPNSQTGSFMDILESRQDENLGIWGPELVDSQRDWEYPDSPTLMRQLSEDSVLSMNSEDAIQLISPLLFASVAPDSPPEGQTFFSGGGSDSEPKTPDSGSLSELKSGRASNPQRMLSFSKDPRRIADVESSIKASTRNLLAHNPLVSSPARASWRQAITQPAKNFKFAQAGSMANLFGERSNTPKLKDIAAAKSLNELRSFREMHGPILSTPTHRNHDKSHRDPATTRIGRADSFGGDVTPPAFTADDDSSSYNFEDSDEESEGGQKSEDLIRSESLKSRSPTRHVRSFSMPQKMVGSKRSSFALALRGKTPLNQVNKVGSFRDIAQQRFDERQERQAQIDTRKNIREMVTGKRSAVLNTKTMTNMKQEFMRQKSLPKTRVGDKRVSLMLALDSKRSGAGALQRTGSFLDLHRNQSRDLQLDSDQDSFSPIPNFRSRPIHSNPNPIYSPQHQESILSKGAQSPASRGFKLATHQEENRKNDYAQSPTLFSLRSAISQDPTTPPRGVRRYRDPGSSNLLPSPKTAFTLAPIKANTRLHFGRTDINGSESKSVSVEEFTDQLTESDDSTLHRNKSEISGQQPFIFE